MNLVFEVIIAVSQEKLRSFSNHDPSDGYWHDNIREIEQFFCDFSGFRGFLRSDGSGRPFDFAPSTKSLADKQGRQRENTIVDKY